MRQVQEQVLQALQHHGELAGSRLRLQKKLQRHHLPSAWARVAENSAFFFGWLFGQGSVLGSMALQKFWVIPGIAI